MESVNTILLIFLEMTFVFVALLLLFSQRKSIGDIPFYITLGMLLIFGEFMVGASLSFTGWSWAIFPVAPVVIFVPFMAAGLLIYITDGVLSFQRLIIGSLVTMGVFFYLGDLTRLQVRWITHSITGSLPLEAFDILMVQTRGAMLAVVCGHLLALFIMPVVFSRLRNTGHNMFGCCCGALIFALSADTLVYELITVGVWQEISKTLLPMLAIRAVGGIYMAALLTLYVLKIGRESEARHVRPLEIVFAFLGGYGRSKHLEANLIEWEGRYRVILENASEMIVIVDKNCKILDANRAASQMLDNAVLGGRKFESFLNEKDALLFMEKLEYARKHTAGSGQFYVQLERAAGNNDEPVVVYLALTVTSMSLGALDAFIIMGRDITEERNLEADKQRLNEELSHSQRLEALGQLAGGVAHDFNNNIHAILGHADLIGLRCNLDEKSSNHLSKIIEIAENSGQLTSQLLGFARKGKYRESDFDLRVLVQRTTDLFLPGSKDIAVTVNTASTPLLVRGDQIQLQQVFLNLMINARDALRMVEDRERQLNIMLEEADTANLPDEISVPELPGDNESKSFVLLTISDNGCGMDETTLKRLYEPFFTTKPVGQGTGMGMAMAYGTIHSHHGSIGVTSKVNIGTSIYILLPRL